MCDVVGVQRGYYFGREPVKSEGEVREGNLINGKAAGMDEIIQEMVKGGSELGVDWIWELCNIAYDSGVVATGDWRFAASVPLYKSKGEKTELLEL